VSNNTAPSQQDNNTAGEAPVAAPTAKGELSGQFTKEMEIEASTLSAEPGHNVMGQFFTRLNVSSANNIDQSIINEHTQISDTSLVTTTAQAMAPTLSQPTPIQKNSANSHPGQSYNTANFAAANRIMPPSIETIGDSTLSIIRASTASLASDTTQPTVPDSTTILASSAPLSSASPTAVTPPDISLNAQLGQPKWGDEFAQKIVWLAGQQQQVAEIRLNPAHLGPIEIMLSITNDQGTQATAQFVSSHLAVREAIEAAMPKLREMMADNGITLGNVTVDSNSSQQQKDSWRQENTATRFSTNQPDTHSESTDQLKTTITTSNHRGMVNTFA
jgi:flagellar hook-length control protein FliK